VTKTNELARTLSLTDSVAILVGIVVGGGIFLLPRLIAAELPSAPGILAVWAASGVLCFFGALAYAEMGAMMPLTGGHYVFLRECYGPLAAFLSGWTFSLVVSAGAIAWLAVSFSITLSYFFPLGPAASKLLAVGLIAGLTVVNYCGIKAGSAVQNASTWLKLAGIAVIVGSAFLPGRPHAAIDWWPAASGFSWSHFGVAMLATLLSYDGWSNISYVAGEIREPRRNLPLVLGIGLAIAIAVYLLANLAYLRVLPISEIAASQRVGADVAARTLGTAGGAVVSITILLSILGAANGHILTTPRLLFAMSRDGLIFESLGQIHPRFQTMSFNIAMQGLWAAVLVVTGSFETLVTYAMFAAFIFYGLTVPGVIILRRKYPNRERPYRMWGYPVTPVLFTATAAWFVLNTLITTPGPALAAILIILTGIPVYYMWQSRIRRLAALPGEAK